MQRPRVNLADALRTIYTVRPGMPVLPVSAKTGKGKEELLDFLRAPA